MYAKSSTLARFVLVLLTSSLALHLDSLDDQPVRIKQHRVSNNAVVHVAYATTPDGFPGLLHSMISVARNFQGSMCHIHVIVAEEHLKKAGEVVACFERDVANLTSSISSAVVRSGTTASLHAMPSLPWDTSLMRTSAEGLARSWGHQDKLSQPTVFARFYLQQILHDLPRVLWLDVDTIVTTDVTKLYQTKLTHAIAARAIKKVVVGHEFKNWSCTKALNQSHEFKSFNTGVMVLDLERWREGNFTQQLEQTAAGCVTNDQPTFNIVFMDKVQYFEKTWNTFALGSTVKARTKREGNILHWSGPVKPWSEPEKCGNPGVRDNDTDCLSAENHADYDAYAPSQECPATEPARPAAGRRPFSYDAYGPLPPAAGEARPVALAAERSLAGTAAWCGLALLLPFL